MLLLSASRQVCPAFLGCALLAHNTAACQTRHSQLLGAKEKALLWWGPFLTALGAGYSPVTSCHFKECFFCFRYDELSVMGCVSLHLSASILAPGGPCQVGGLGPLAVGLLWHREVPNCIQGRAGRCLPTALEVPASPWPLFVIFWGQFCGLQPRQMWKWMPVSF